MSAFDDAFHVLEKSPWKRFQRDLRLLLWLGKFTLFYTIVGGKIRRRYLRCKAAGEPYWLD